MKVRDAKFFVQQLMHAEKWDQQFINENFQPLVEISQKNRNDKESLYRVVMIESKEGKLNSHTIASLSKSLEVCMKIEDQMPSILLGESETLSFDALYMRFDVPRDNVLLDCEACLPVLKEKLKNVLSHTIEGKYGERIRLDRAIELIEEADEKEFICDLTNLTPSSSFRLGQGVSERLVRAAVTESMNKVMDRYDCSIYDEAVRKRAVKFVRTVPESSESKVLLDYMTSNFKMSPLRSGSSLSLA